MRCQSVGAASGRTRDQRHRPFDTVHLDPTDDLTAMDVLAEVSQFDLQRMVVVLVPPEHVTLVRETEGDASSLPKPIVPNTAPLANPTST